MVFSRRRRPDEPADGISPWSSEANAPDAPPLTWETPEPRADELAGNPHSDEDPLTPVTGPSRTGWIAAAVVAVATMAGLVWLWPTNVDEGADADLADDSPVTTLDTLPPPTTVVDAPTPDEEEDRLEESEDGADAGAGGTGDPAPVERASVPDVQTLSLPSQLPDFTQPFELVMTTRDGLVTLSFPSGTLRTTPLDTPRSGFSPDGLVVAPDASLVNYGTSALIVDRTGRSIEVDLGNNDGGGSPIGWGSIDGETVFTMLQWSEFGVAQFAIVNRDGTVRSTETPVSWPVLTASDGSLIVNDAGGTYRLAPDGTPTRISDGAIVGFGSDRVGVRTCDEQLACSLSTLDLATGEVIEYVGQDAADVQRFGGFGDVAVVSPDGTMVVETQASEVDGTIGDLIIHADGASYTGGLEGARSWPWSSRPTWAPDSSGYFRTGPSPQSPLSNLRFTNRTGDLVTIEGLPDTIGWSAVRVVDEELPAIEPGSLGIAPIPDIDVGLVGLDRGAAVHIDLGAGSMATWATPDLGDLPDLFHVDTAVIGISADGDESFRSFAGAVMDSRTDQAEPPGAPRYQGSDDRLVWRPDPTGETYELVPMPFHDMAGRNAWRTIEVGADAVYGTDDAGGLVYEQGGDIFVSDASGPQRLTSGELVAIGPTAALVHECDDAGACRNVLVDDEGRSDVLAGPPAAARPVRQGEAVDGSFSPDGEVMLVQLPANTLDGTVTDEEFSEWALVDRSSATAVPAPPPDRGAAVHWTADGSYAFYLSGDRIQVFDRVAQRVQSLDGAGDFDVITLVPLEFAAVAAAD